MFQSIRYIFGNFVGWTLHSGGDWYCVAVNSSMISIRKSLSLARFSFPKDISKMHSLLQLKKKMPDIFAMPKCASQCDNQNGQYRCLLGLSAISTYPLDMLG